MFHKWFPKDVLPADYFQSFIKHESEILQKNILDLAKVWDSKLVKLRQDMNVHSILKKINEKAENAEVQQSFEAHQQRIQQIEYTFVELINEVETLNMQYI